MQNSNSKKNLREEENFWGPSVAAEGCSPPQELEKNRSYGGNFSSFTRLYVLSFYQSSEYFISADEADLNIYPHQENL